MSRLDPKALEDKLWRNETLDEEEMRALAELMATIAACFRADLGKSDADSVTGYRLLLGDYDRHFTRPTTEA